MSNKLTCYETNCIVLVIVLSVNVTFSQVGPAEFMAGDNYLHYQHALGKYLKPGSSFGWQHVATLIKWHTADTKRRIGPDELMNQVYLTYSISEAVLAKAGLFYTNAGGYQPSIGMQFVMKPRDGVFVLSPSMDVAANRSYEYLGRLNICRPYRVT